MILTGVPMATGVPVITDRVPMILAGVPMAAGVPVIRAGVAGITDRVPMIFTRVAVIRAGVSMTAGVPTRARQGGRGTALIRDRDGRNPGVEIAGVPMTGGIPVIRAGVAVIRAGVPMAAVGLPQVDGRYRAGGRVVSRPIRIRPLVALVCPDGGRGRPHGDLMSVRFSLPIGTVIRLYSLVAGLG